MTKNNLGIVLGGGRGSRLLPLTNKRAKPAVPFGATHRVGDFSLSNLLNSYIRKIYVITQFESRSYHRHIQYGFAHRVGEGEFIQPLAARQTNSGGWSRGTAEAVYQNMDYLIDDDFNIVDILGSDQVYVMDVSQMNDFHAKKGADLTISAIPIKRSLAAKNFGVIEVDGNWKIKGFEEKPESPKPMPGNKEYCLVSMGKYAFSKDALLEALTKDAKKEFTSEEDVIKSNPDNFSRYDFGFDIIPAMLREKKEVFAYDFSTNFVPGQQEHEKGYWRDVGSIEEFYKVSMELRSSKPPINLHNDKWEIFTYVETSKPVQFKGKGYVLESIVANGSVIKGTAKGSVISYNTTINEGAEVTDSILMGKKTIIGSGAIVKNAIIDKGVKVPDKETVGVDEEKDRERGFYNYSTTSIRPVVPEDYIFPEK